MEKKLMEKIWSGLHLEIPLYTFRKMQETKTSFRELNKMLKDFKNLRNKYLGYNLGNNMHEIRFDVSSSSHNFPFLIMDERFVVWDDNGDSLGDFKIDINEVPSDKFIEYIESRVQDYCILGITHCSHCNKVLDVKKDIAGRYFAGIYCRECCAGNENIVQKKNEKRMTKERRRT